MEDNTLAVQPCEEQDVTDASDDVPEDACDNDTSNIYIEEKYTDGDGERDSALSVSLETVAAVTRETSDIKRERRRLLFGLVCTLLAAVTVTVYGTLAALEGSKAMPLSERLMGEVLGVPVRVYEGESGARLDKIPPQTVEDGEFPGAAENESQGAAEEPDEPSAGEWLPIIDVDFSVGADDPFAIINETPYTPDVSSLIGAHSQRPTLDELRATYGEDAPFVLILHTHGTEAYSDHLAEGYNSAESFRSLDGERGVVAVGREIKRVLEAHGIGVIHIETMFDAESFNDAYYFAAEEIKRILGENPSVKYIFDIHRDAMVASDGSALRPVSPSTGTVEGVSPAQIMLVVGTDHAGSGHVGWKDNLSLALELQQSALAFDPSLMRPINLRSPSFNQQYSPQSLLVEIGSAANSVEQACLSGMIFAEAVSRVIEGTAAV